MNERTNVNVIFNVKYEERLCGIRIPSSFVRLYPCPVYENHCRNIFFFLFFLLRCFPLCRCVMCVCGDFVGSGTGDACVTFHWNSIARIFCATQLVLCVVQAPVQPKIYLSVHTSTSDGYQLLSSVSRCADGFEKQYKICSAVIWIKAPAQRALEIFKNIQRHVRHRRVWWAVRLCAHSSHQTPYVLNDDQWRLCEPMQWVFFLSVYLKSGC